ncbi:MAG TPA: pseudouridine synthase [Candidatus Angelobacter sp.]|nr:pseudouridine synthase [Candidatus Angelobacter sp.]
MAEERLQKIIAAAGIASRRKAEELITQGRVTVNGQVVTELGSKADLARDHVKVDGKLLQGSERHIYLLLHKPKGYVTTVSDPEGRPTVMDLVKNVGERIYPLGRLDYNSEGLLLLSNDGDLANYLTQAASNVPKVYLVKVAGNPPEDAVEKLRHGVRIGSKPGARGMHAVRTAPAEIKLVKPGENPWYEITLYEGKNRQIRRMFEEIGHHVEKIKRVRYGPLSLDVEPGEIRELTPGEVAALRRPVSRPAPEPERNAAKESVRYLGKAKPAERRDRDRRQGKRRPAETREAGEAKPFRGERDRKGRAPRREGGFAGSGSRAEQDRRFERRDIGDRQKEREQRGPSQDRGPRGQRRGWSKPSGQSERFDRGQRRFRAERPEYGSQRDQKEGDSQQDRGEFRRGRKQFGRPDRKAFQRSSRESGRSERRTGGNRPNARGNRPETSGNRPETRGSRPDARGNRQSGQRSRPRKPRGT